MAASSSKKRKDEIEKLEKSIQLLIKRDIQITDAREKLREKVKELENTKRELQEKIKELERFQELTVGRELRMVELKRENNNLKKEIRELTGEEE